MDIVPNIALISINETLIFQVISFLIFLYIINRVMFRPLRNVMAERDRHIENLKSDTAGAQKKFDSITDQIGEQESAVRKEALLLKAKLEDEGNSEADKILAAVRKEIADKNEAAKIEVEAQVAAARTEIQTESETLAINIIETILDRRLNP
jgi:F-type H+-transporting ATPase subunit b